MKAKHILKEFPLFAEIFDGEAEENTLLFYYKQDNETGIYEFKDEASEEDVAELMGVKERINRKGIHTSSIKYP